ncbi:MULTISPECIES: DegT/DnrJ/EryC1/StrS family aminotransferase [unclassified Rathayibacter]|uniref:DegT/DnrJ/EryC1/StrS family aminotransferase n=1 Tax=unclassified Rathayibacter TaxID=2609250 RepID=UPI0006F82956|nr:MULTISPECIES: DegT/DnrJ/EryC1/StrS family aminotransferase [unclassified Rathayibacter]KQQ01429.1 glutamine--scyllo-inositol aminotransferase [Rathayibacter sp. Leaf294]KQS11460.1 glutamine--scyllo-inositol aminotransferase [Rathayibacter sp. Leaf185]
MSAEVLPRIDVMRPWLGQEEVDALAEVVASGWIAQGPRVARFEEAFAAAMGVEHAVALSSCTTALHLGLVVAGVSSGDDVVVPSFSFIATANAVVHAGARPVFADVDPTTGNVTAETIRVALTPATRAVIAVDQGGVPVDLDPIRALCDPLGIVVLEDAACGAGAQYRGRPVGASAELTAWSFHPRKLLTTGEGGMLTTNDAGLAARARRLREHSMSVSAADRHGSLLSPPEQYDEVGFNYRMTDLQAALGLVQLGRLEALVSRRRALAARYSEAFADVPGLRTVEDPAHGTGNVQSFWVEVGDEYPLDRDGLMAELASRGISARRGIMAAHRQPPYREHPGADRLPATERLTDRTLILPLFHALTAVEQDRVIDAVLAPSRLTEVPADA